MTEEIASLKGTLAVYYYAKIYATLKYSTLVCNKQRPLALLI